MAEAPGAAKSTLQRLLDFVEVAGNMAPHPAVLFGWLMCCVIVLSAGLSWLQVGVSYERVNPETHEIEHATTMVRSLLSAAGIRIPKWAIMAFLLWYWLGIPFGPR